MAEVVGTIASVVTLFEVCIKGFEFIRNIQHRDADLRRLTVKLGLEHARLFTWGEVMGLTQKSSGHKSLISQFKFQSLVEDVLKLIMELLDDSEKTRAKYGCKSISQSSASTSLSRRPEVFSFVRLSTASMAQRVMWAVVDKDKFAKLVAEAKELIDGLQDLTKELCTSQSQQEIVKNRICSIDDVSTLEVVAEVCKDIYPDISDVASNRVESLSSVDGREFTILDWTNALEDIPEDDEDEDGYTIEDVESMGVAELKRYCFTLLYRNRRPKQTSNETADAHPEAQSHYPEDGLPMRPRHHKTGNDVGPTFDLPMRSTKEQAIASSVPPVSDAGLEKSGGGDAARADLSRKRSKSVEPPKKQSPSTGNPTTSAPKQVSSYRPHKKLPPLPFPALPPSIPKVVPSEKWALEVNGRREEFDKDFADELDAILQWYSVVSPSERVALLTSWWSVMDKDRGEINSAGKEEIDTIQQWFKVLAEGEKQTAFSYLMLHMSGSFVNISPST